MVERRRWRVEVPIHGADQRGDRRLDATLLHINPLRFAQEVLEGSGQRRRVRAQRDDRTPLRGGPLDFLADVRRFYSLFRENETTAVASLIAPTISSA
jgi:hypothetical protein